MEETTELVGGEVGVEVEDDEGALVVGVGEGVGVREDVVGREEARVGVEVELHGADGGEGGLCMAEVEEVDGENAVAEGFGLEGSDVSEGLELGSEGGVGGERDRGEEEGAGGGGGEVRRREGYGKRKRKRRRKRVPLALNIYGVGSELFCSRV